MAKYVTLEQWARTHYDPPPHPNTLRKWAKDGYIQPAPQKHGRVFRVREDAVYQDYRVPPTTSLVKRIGG